MEALSERAGDDILWLTQSLDDVPADDAWLGPQELVTLHRFRVPKRLHEWRLGRWTAKCAVASVLGPELVLSFPALEVIASPDGAPEVWFGDHPAPVSISVSHSDQVGLAVVGPRRLALGCDVESVEERSPTFVTDYFTGRETALIEASNADERDLLATLLWSAKESALKALRTGLRADTRSIEISPQETGAADGWRGLEIRPGRLWGWWREAGSMVITVVSNAPSEPPRAANLQLAPPYAKS
jgi:4'-phosphopantetheinyl transferase